MVVVEVILYSFLSAIYNHSCFIGFHLLFVPVFVDEQIAAHLTIELFIEKVCNIIIYKLNLLIGELGSTVASTVSFLIPTVLLHLS